MTQASAKENQTRGINRTICIGLGELVEMY